MKNYGKIIVDNSNIATISNGKLNINENAMEGDSFKVILVTNNGIVKNCKVVVER